MRAPPSAAWCGAWALRARARRARRAARGADWWRGCSCTRRSPTWRASRTSPWRATRAGSYCSAIGSHSHSLTSLSLSHSLPSLVLSPHSLSPPTHSLPSLVLSPHSLSPLIHPLLFTFSLSHNTTFCKHFCL